MTSLAAHEIRNTRRPSWNLQRHHCFNNTTCSPHQVPFQIPSHSPVSPQAARPCKTLIRTCYNNTCSVSTGRHMFRRNALQLLLLDFCDLCRHQLRQRADQRLCLSAAVVFDSPGLRGSHDTTESRRGALHRDEAIRSQRQGDGRQRQRR